MIGLTAKTTDETKKVEKAVDKANFKNFGHAANRISKDAKDSIQKAPAGVPSEPGTPPHTHKRIFMRRAIRYAADRDGAVIGPVASIVGTAGEAHEYGGKYKGQEFPERPTMYPALLRNTDRFAGSWRGSVGA